MKAIEKELRNSSVAYALVLDSKRIYLHHAEDWVSGVRSDLMFGGPLYGFINTFINLEAQSTKVKKFLAPLVVNRLGLETIAGSAKLDSRTFGILHLLLRWRFAPRNIRVLQFPRISNGSSQFDSHVLFEWGVPIAYVSPSGAEPILKRSSSRMGNYIWTPDHLLLLAAPGLRVLPASESEFSNFRKTAFFLGRILQCVVQPLLVRTMFNRLSVKLYRALQIKLMRLLLLKIILLTRQKK